jgi:hypothetical protein
MGSPERIRPEVTQYASVLVLSAVAAVLVGMGFAHVHAEITTVEQAQGYVDPVLQTGVLLGFLVMGGCAVALAVAAVWAAVKLVGAMRAKKS